MTFEAFPKIKRLSRECVVTEKLDGTNAQILIVDDTLHIPGEFGPSILGPQSPNGGYYKIYVGSRTRWIAPGKSTDNFGFAGWVEANAAEIVKLGPGRHYGEWWGAGIQRGYDLKEKRFSLFNTDRWSDDAVRPACCHVVPELYRGEFSTSAIDGLIDYMRREGSTAAPGFMNPEGVIVWHTAARVMFKKTLDGDQHKDAA